MVFVSVAYHAILSHGWNIHVQCLVVVQMLRLSDGAVLRVFSVVAVCLHVAHVCPLYLSMPVAQALACSGSLPASLHKPHGDPHKLTSSLGPSSSFAFFFNPLTCSAIFSITSCTKPRSSHTHAMSPCMFCIPFSMYAIFLHDVVLCIAHRHNSAVYVAQTV